MKKFFKKVEDMYAASAFAEAGEFETATAIVRERRTAEKKLQKRTNKQKRTRLSAN